MFGGYGSYIVPAYLVSAAVIAALIAWPAIVYRRRLREIAALEDQGVPRRSGKRSNGGS